MVLASVFDPTCLKKEKIKTYFATKIFNDPIGNVIFTRISVKLHWGEKKCFPLNAREVYLSENFFFKTMHTSQQPHNYIPKGCSNKKGTKLLSKVQCICQDCLEV